MLSSYDLTNFSKRLKTIRKSLGYSQNEVSEKTGVNSDTLRRLENGMSVPRFDTLEVLSQFYRENLILLLDSYKTSISLSYFYDLIDYHITNDDRNSIKETITIFESFISTTNLQLVDQREINQLKIFFKGIEISYGETKDAYQESLQVLIEAIQISIPSFKLKNWNTYKFNFLELRILFTMASILGLLRECLISNEILLFILNYVDPSKYAKYYEKLLIIKSYSILAYNYHRIENHELAITYSERGIDFCIEHSIMNNLSLLLCRKGIAMFYLNIDGFEKFFFQGIELLKIQNKYQLAEQYEEILHRYIYNHSKKSEIKDLEL